MLKMTLVFVTLFASIADAQQESKTPKRFFGEERVDFWRDGSADRKPVSDSGVSESIWAEPIRMPDGRYTTYLPPRQVLEFLENPTAENVRHYREWQSQRMDKIRKASAVLAEVQREKPGKTAKQIGAIAITYFRKAGCPYCAKQDAVLEGMKKRYPDLEIKVLEPGQEPELWQRLGVTAVPTLLVSADGGRPVMIRGYADADKILNAAIGATHESK